jgi:3-hydroxybutyryl-CoA dehydratase
MKITYETPPRRIALSDIREGEFISQSVRFKQEDLDNFGKTSGDVASIHFDSVFGRTKGFDGVVVHGLLVTSKFSRLLGMYLPGENSIVQSINFNFKNPIYLHNTLLYEVSVNRIIPTVNAVLLDLKVSVEGTIFVQGKAQCVCIADRAIETE